jgi:hypothetical protein
MNKLRLERGAGERSGKGQTGHLPISKSGRPPKKARRSCQRQVGACTGTFGQPWSQQTRDTNPLVESPGSFAERRPAWTPSTATPS